MTSSPSTQLKIAIITTVSFLTLVLLIFLFAKVEISAAISLYLLPLLAVLCATFIIITWFQLRSEARVIEILGTFALGFSLWAIAEIIWLAFVIAGLDPYPSIADFFWLVGYIPLGLALINGINTIKLRLDLKQTLFIVTMMIISMLLIIYLIFVPIIQEITPDRIFEGIVNLLYPVLDLILVALLLILSISTRKSRFNIAWLFIGLGLGFTNVADLVYGYASWYEIYTGDFTNAISIFIDWAYIAGYPVFALGIFAYRIAVKHNPAQSILPSFETQEESNLANITYLVYTDAKDHIIQVSENLFFTIPDTQSYPLQDFLSIITGSDPKSGEGLFLSLKSELQTHDLISELPIQLEFPDQTSQLAWISGIPIYTAGKDFAGMNLAIRTYKPGIMPNEGLSEHHAQIAHYIIKKCAIHIFPFSEAWLSFTNQWIDVLVVALTSNVGEPTAKELLALLAEIISQEKFPLLLSGSRLVSIGNPNLPIMHRALTTLLARAENFAINFLPTDFMRKAYAELEPNLNERVLLVARDFQLSAFVNAH